MKIIRSFVICTMVVGAISSARADDADLAQVLRTLKALESRVASLESEKQQYRREAASARAETQALKQKFGHQPGPVSSPQLPPSGSYAMMTQTPIQPAVSTWGGLYAGASFGITSQHANQDGVESSVSTSTFVQPGFTSTNSNSQTLTSSLGGRGTGAMSNLYLGYNYILPSSFLVGAEIEGGISNMRTSMNGMISGPAQSISTNTQFGVTTTSTTTGPTTGNTILNLDNRWAMSALVRGGLLVDPRDLIYLVGGLTYGRFELLDESLGAFGGTVGAGWERKITPSWTLRAEYRYTRFQDRTITENSNSSSSAVGAATSSASSSAFQESSKISGLDWHTVSIGVSHYFDANQGNRQSQGKLPPDYRDWRLISVAHEAGNLNDLRAILGNDLAVEAFREGKLPFPDGAIIARLAWDFVSSEENDKAFGRTQSFVAGSPKEGVQFMVKDEAALRGLTHLVPIQPGLPILRVRRPSPEAHRLDRKRSGLQAIPQAERREGASTAL